MIHHVAWLRVADHDRREHICACRSVAHLASSIHAPTPDAAVGFDRETEIGPSAELGHVGQRWNGIQSDLHRRGRIIRSSVAQFADEIISPRPERAVKLQGHVVRLTAHYGHDGMKIINVCCAMNLDRKERPAGGGIDAELAKTTGTPRPHCAVGLEDDRAARAAPK